MDERVKSLFDDIEIRRQHFLQTLERLPEARRKESPSPNVWTPSQLIEHLVLAEETQLAELRASKPLVATARRWSNGFLVRMVVFTLKNRIRVPVPANMKPSGKVSWDDLKARWERVRSEFIAEIENVDAESLRAKHHVLGWITPIEMLMITNAHLQYHVLRMN